MMTMIVCDDAHCPLLLDDGDDQDDADRDDDADDDDDAGDDADAAVENACDGFSFVCRRC